VDPARLSENAYATAVRSLPVAQLLDARALKHVSHAADRPDETASGDAAHGHGCALGLVHELKLPRGDLGQ